MLFYQLMLINKLHGTCISVYVFCVISGFFESKLNIIQICRCSLSFYYNTIAFFKCQYITIKMYVIYGTLEQYQHSNICICYRDGRETVLTKNSIMIQQLHFKWKTSNHRIKIFNFVQHAFEDELVKRSQSIVNYFNRMYLLIPESTRIKYKFSCNCLLNNILLNLH